MFGPTFNTASFKNTDYKVVLPFYMYAAISFLVAAVLLFFSSAEFKGHYFHPHILSITHLMALGWGTMIILGASHQLVPVLIEEQLYSNLLATISFLFAAIGVPMLVYHFYIFQLGLFAIIGGSLIVLAVLAYLINIGISISKSKNENIHAIFVFTATCWLFLTVSSGLLFLYNFTVPFLSQNSLYYLPLHAHAGIIGWFLLMVLGVASRLVPLFLISKYSNPRLLWWVYGLINAALLFFIAIFFLGTGSTLYLIPLFFLAVGIFIFIYYCYNSYRLRLRKLVDNPMRLSLVSIAFLILPFLALAILLILWVFTTDNLGNLVLAYGFLIFFGWVTAIILGMTFKTLPFIVWNKVYHHLSGIGKTPNPKDLFSTAIFKYMGMAYLGGLLVFLFGVLFRVDLLLQVGALLLLLTAALYNLNLYKILMHKPALK